jgi:hypothetical protein
MGAAHESGAGAADALLPSRWLLEEYIYLYYPLHDEKKGSEDADSESGVNAEWWQPVEPG